MGFIMGVAVQFGDWVGFVFEILGIWGFWH